MFLRRLIALKCVLFISFCSSAAEYVTENFIVSAPNKDLARKFGEYAELYRKQKAIEWLGEPMPRWSSRCPLEVKVSMNRAGGATTFEFLREGGVRSQKMEIFGDLDKMLNSILPHEVTHTVFAYYFGQAVPRWADEGSAVYSENEKERLDHDIKCREFLNQGRGITLRSLFAMQQYPRDVIVLYAQGYSVSSYLLDLGATAQGDPRKRFLDFIATGMKNGNRNWQQAAQLYGFKSVDDLEAAWINSLKNPPVRNKPTVLARGASPSTPRIASNGSIAQLASRDEIRTSVLPALPVLSPPVISQGKTPISTAHSQNLPASELTPRTTSPSALPRFLPPTIPSENR